MNNAAPSDGRFDHLPKPYGNLYALTGRKAHFLEDKQIPSVGVFDESLLYLYDPFSDIVKSTITRTVNQFSMLGFSNKQFMGVELAIAKGHQNKLSNNSSAPHICFLMEDLKEEVEQEGYLQVLLMTSYVDPHQLESSLLTTSIVAVSDEILFLALGWLLEEIHVTWAHLEKKRTRLQTYTKSHDDFCTQWLETASQA
ncbi:hypothetical protein Tco_1174708 [Tanacetum coccineum]